MRFIILIFSFVCSAAAAQEFDSLNSCKTYDEVESKTACGQQGYVAQFGRPYCEAFLQKNDHFSLEGQEVLRNIRSCLQKTMMLELEKNHINCDNMQAVAMHQHTQCYLAAGFCDLPTQDLLKISWMIKKEFWHPSMIRSAFEINRLCIMQKEKGR